MDIIKDTSSMETELETEACFSNFNLNNVGEDWQVQTEETTTEAPRLCNYISVSTQTVLSLQRSQLISYSFLSDRQLKHLSGFYQNEFKLICDFFKTAERHYNCALHMEDEILLTLMKLRHNYYYRSLEMLFDVSNRIVPKIVNFWVNHIYVLLKSVNFWATKCKRSDEEYDIIIDCTEIPIEKSNDPVIQQATYSQYKSTNTFKVLVGCTEYGAVTYVSDVYGGCISDRRIIEESGFLNLLQKNNYVLADRGFDISDLLENKGVHLNIPPFKTKKQLSELDVAKTRAIANRRILIEQLNGLAKKNRIIVDRMPVHMWSMANQIIYICFMLTNFRKSIIWLK